MRRIISLAIFAAVLFMGYNHFYGTDEDRELNKNITDGVKDVGSSLVTLFKKAKTNYDDGKFDDAIQKTTSIISQLGQKAKEIGGNFPERLKELEEKKDQLDKLIETNKTASSNDSEAQEDQIKDEVNQLLKKLETLDEDMNKQ